MKIAFYVAEKGNILDKIINVWTGCYGYSHCEIIFDTINIKGKKRLCCSSSPVDKEVRFRYIDVFSEDWVVVDIPELKSSESELEVYNYLKLKEGNKYDWLGIFFYFILPKVKKQNDKKWWCSELCASVLSEFIEPFNFRISPNKLAKKLDVKKQDFKFSFSIGGKF